MSPKSTEVPQIDSFCFLRICSLTRSLSIPVLLFPLSSRARLKNIEDTEKAKKALYEQRKNRSHNPSQSREADEQLANARFFRGGQRREPQSDSDALARARGQAPANGGANSTGGNRNHNGKDRRDMASDDLVMGRFKKRQRSGFK